MKKLLVVLVVALIAVSCDNRKKIITGRAWNTESIVFDSKIQDKKKEDEFSLIFNEDGSITSSGKEKMFEKWRFKGDSLVLNTVPLIGFDNKEYGKSEERVFYIEQLTEKNLIIIIGNNTENMKIIFVR